MKVMKAFGLAGALIALAGPYESSRSDGFEEYALQSCLTDCYATFRPVNKPTDYTNCVDRCRRIYEKSKQSGSFGRKKW